MKKNINILRNLILLWRNREILEKSADRKYLVNINLLEEEKDGFETLAVIGLFVQCEHKTLKEEMNKLPKI